MTIFTTIRISDGAPWFLDEHAARLGVDSRRLRSLLPSFDARVRVFDDLFLQVESLRLPGEPWTIEPTDGDVSVRGPLQKTTDRTHYDRARAQAQQPTEADVSRASAERAKADDALLIGPDGRIRETTIANVFFVLADGTLVTPPASDGLLPGIARGWILQACGGEERPLRLADVQNARECFATNALMLAHPVTAITGVAEYAPGPTAAQAAAACRPRCD